MKRTLKMLLVAGLPLVFSLTACGGGGGGTGEELGPRESTPERTAGRASSQMAVPADYPYRVTVLGGLGRQSYALALNDEGQVVGNYRDADGAIHVFGWKDDLARTLVENAQVAKINSSGQAVGWIEKAGGCQAYLCDLDGQVYDLPTTGGSSRALALNDLGQTAGRISDQGDRAFFEDNGRLELIASDLDGYAVGLNNRGDILLKAVDGSAIRSLLLREGQIIDLGSLGGEDTQAEDINQAGEIVGWSETAAGEIHAFVWRDGEMLDLGAPGGDVGAAVAINDRGEILLKVSAVEADRTLLYRQGRIVDLGNFGADYAVATDLNNHGEIVGVLQAPDGTLRAFFATPR